MTDAHLIRLVLQYLYTLAQRTEPASIGQIACDLGLSRAVVARILLTLDRAGLVDCARVRLTLPGLALAVSTRTPAVLAAAA